MKTCMCHTCRQEHVINTLCKIGTCATGDNRTEEAAFMESQRPRGIAPGWPSMYAMLVEQKRVERGYVQGAEWSRLLLSIAFKWESIWEQDMGDARILPRNGFPINVAECERILKDALVAHGAPTFIFTPE